MRAVAVTAIVFALVATGGASAQQPQPAPAAPAAPTAPAPATAARPPQPARPVTPAQAPRPVSPAPAPAPATPPGSAPFVRVEPDQPGQLVNIQIDIMLLSEGGTQGAGTQDGHAHAGRQAGRIGTLDGSRTRGAGLAERGCAARGAGERTGAHAHWPRVLGRRRRALRPGARAAAARVGTGAADLSRGEPQDRSIGDRGGDGDRAQVGYDAVVCRRSSSPTAARSRCGSSAPVATSAWRRWRSSPRAIARARHVRMADEAVPIGPSPPRDSYLRIDTPDCGARAPPAPTRCIPATASSPRTPPSPPPARTPASPSSAPRPRAIELMGSKTAAREAARAAGVPDRAGHRRAARARGGRRRARRRRTPRRLSRSW